MRTPFILTVVLGTITAAITAPVAPYENPLAAEPPYYRVRYEAPAEPKEGELIYPVSYTIWIPPGVETLRGLIVHQHGCGEGSCKSGQTGAYDLHWQALAKKHDCALMGPSYEQPDKADCQKWCDPRQGSDAAFQKALADLGKMSGHPELTTAPWALWGHSGGGHWAGGISLLHPERVAAAWLRSGVPPVAAVEGKPAPYTITAGATTVPLMCNLGTKEGVTDKEGRFAGVSAGVETFFKTMRAEGSLVGVSVDPLSSHDCGNQRYLAIPWLDACLAARLPEKAGDPLKAMPKGESWLAPLDLEAQGKVAPLPESNFVGPLESSVWLPNEAIARAWSSYVKDTAVPDTTPPPAPTDLVVKGNELTWECEADLESGLAGFVIERDGVVIAKLPEKGTNPFGRPVFQNLSYSDSPTQPLVGMRYTDPAPGSGKAHRYRIIAVNTVGLESKSE
jgi:pimeloyl-ACP methyl ester carboxylesterase